MINHTVKWCKTSNNCNVRTYTSKLYSRRLRRDSARVGSAGTAALGSCLHSTQEACDHSFWQMHSTGYTPRVSAVQT